MEFMALEDHRKVTTEVCRLRNGGICQMKLRTETFGVLEIYDGANFFVANLQQ